MNKEMEKFQQECIKKYGYYIHFVAGKTSPLSKYTPINAHTHGLMETWNHPEYTNCTSTCTRNSKRIVRLCGITD